MPIDLVIDERDTDSKTKVVGGTGSTGSSSGSTNEGVGNIGEHANSQEQVRAEC